MTPQTQFTPGPWNVKRGERCLFIYDSREDVPSIAHLGRTGMDHDDEANARLIASAPALYAALQKMVEAYDALRETTGYREIGTSDCTAGAWLETQFGGISAHAPINMAREALAMGNGGGLGSSTPR